jgi:RimJ/RimL family protein N-acetyltransferase
MEVINFDTFSIRPLNIEDSNEFFNLIDQNRSRLEDFFTITISRTRTLEDAKAYVEAITKKAEAKIYLPYLIVNNENNGLIGFIDIKNIDWNIPMGELGFFIDKEYSGKGIFTKALKAFIDFCFANYGFHKLFLRTHESNFSARRVAENCGFVMERKLRRDHKTPGGDLVDLLYYGKISNIIKP